MSQSQCVRATTEFINVSRRGAASQSAALSPQEYVHMSGVGPEPGVLRG